MTENHRSLWPAIIVSALGYFVDLYDLLLFSVVRSNSLTDLGVAPDAILTVGLNLLNWMLIGMMAGGIVWGILGDKKGRVSVLFGSIIIYSVANFLNGYIHSVEQYRVLRLLNTWLTTVQRMSPTDIKIYVTITAVPVAGICRMPNAWANSGVAVISTPIT